MGFGSVCDPRREASALGQRVAANSISSVGLLKADQGDFGFALAIFTIEQHDDVFCTAAGQ